MIKKIKLNNFRNFQKWEFFFSEWKNYIIWENGKWKTNILESLSLLTWNSITWISFENLVRENESFFHIEMENEQWSSMIIFFDKELNKKKYSINKKNITKKKFVEISLKSVTFSPIVMNMFYLWPALRRDFIDNILFSSFSEYDLILKNYKKSLLTRNRILKNIWIWNSDVSEIKFWNNDFIKNATGVYKYRFILMKFLMKNSYRLVKSFSWKIDKIDFINLSKINFLDWDKFDIIKVWHEIKSYLEENIQKEIILKTTTVWPHRDDFNFILNDNFNLIDFASRWETKTIILELKNLEIKFIEEKTSRKPILIVDDLLSELDKKHKDLFLNDIDWYQTFITWIRLNIEWKEKLINL